MRFFAPFIFAAALALHAEQPVVDSHAAEAPPAENDPDIALAFRLESAFQKLAKRVAPSVVSLQVSARTKDWTDEMRRMSDHLGPSSLERTYEGSGVIIDPAGWIVTNEHVVRDADSINVTFSDGRTCLASVTGLDKRSDLAMLKVVGDDAPKDLPCAVLADSDKVQVGQYSMAIGNPFGLSNSFTLGVISARGRFLNRPTASNDAFYGNLIQTEAPINPGNSGGPLFDLSGKLIGINTMIFSTSGVSQGFGFAIPSNHLKPRLNYLKIGREIEYGWLGVALQELDTLKREFKVPDNKGVMVEKVIPNSPAERAGLTHGMVILDFDGARMGNVQELIAAVNATPVGRNVKVKVLDTVGHVTDVAVRISKRYAEVAQPQIFRPGNPDPHLIDPEEINGALTGEGPSKAVKIDKVQPPPFVWRGMEFKELSADDGKKRGGRIEIKRVWTGSPADRAGLYEGAILTEFKHAGDKAIQKLEALDALKKLSETTTGPVALYTPLDGYVTIEEK